jgi:hypothetical protein
MNEEMLRWLDAKEREAKVRRISCGMRVPASKTDAILTCIRERRRHARCPRKVAAERVLCDRHECRSCCDGDADIGKVDFEDRAG